MSADKLHAIGDLPLQGFPRPGFDVLMAEQRFPLRPALNPLEQSTGLIQFGSPAVWVVSRWICGSIKGGIASPPRAFNTS